MTFWLFLWLFDFFCDFWLFLWLFHFYCDFFDFFVTFWLFCDFLIFLWLFDFFCDFFVTFENVYEIFLSDLPLGFGPWRWVMDLLKRAFGTWQSDRNWKNPIRAIRWSQRNISDYVCYNLGKNCILLFHKLSATAVNSEPSRRKNHQIADQNSSLWQAQEGGSFFALL